MKLIAITELRYAGVNYFPGNEFEGSDNDAMLLKAIGKAKDAPAKAVATKSLKAEAPETKASTQPAQGDVFNQPTEEKSTTGRRRYMRRDMIAEE